MSLSSFPKLSHLVINDLNTDQLCTYKIYYAVVHGKFDDVMYLEVGQIVYSRWLTLGCILYSFVPPDDPPWNLEILGTWNLEKPWNLEFGIFFGPWLELKLNNQTTHKSKNFFNLA